MSKMLSEKGYKVIILDNLSTGHKEAARFGELIIGDIADSTLLDNIFSEYKIESVMHFAASSIVGESVLNPLKYYHNNVVKTLAMLDSMVRNNVNNIIFSSTAAIFGEPKYILIDENHPKKPINPYGSSKLIIEKILEDFYISYKLNSISLRYFNACGADLDLEIGEMHEPETHLIPLILQVPSGKRDVINIFGSDYETKDGTCIRDYIHIIDICEAHLLSLELLLNNEIDGANAFNLGNGKGFSVREVINAAEEIVKEFDKNIKENIAVRRQGDPAILIADGKKAADILGWDPQYKDIKDMILHAWKWELKCFNH